MTLVNHFLTVVTGTTSAFLAATGAVIGAATAATIFSAILAGSGAFVFCSILAGAALFGAADFGALALTTGAMA